METPFQERSITARLDARYRDTGAPAYQALYYWGLLNCVLVFAQQYLNFILNPIGAQKFTYISTGLWVFVALWTRRAPLRLPFFIMIMMILQVWLSICSLRGQMVVGTMTVPNAMDFVFLVYVLAFIQAAMLVWFAPESRKVFGLVTIIISVISSFTAFLQFFGLGPAIELARKIREADIVFAGAEQSEIIRAPGLHSAVGNAVVWPCAAALMVAVVIKYRPIKWTDIVAVMLLLGSATIIQIRNQMLLVAVCAIWIFYWAYKKHGQRVLVAGVSVACAVVMFIALQPDRFGYLLQGTDTLDFRQTRLWPQARYVLQEQPYFGIGVEPAFAGWTTQVLPNKWMNVGLIDNGFYLMGIWGGYPAIGILALMLIIGLASAIVALHQPNEDYWHEAFKLATVALMIFNLTGMFWGSLFANPVPVGVMFTCAGLSLNSYRSTLNRDNRAETAMEAAGTA